MELTRFEKIVVITVLIIGLLGGVALAYLKQPPIIAAVFIAMSIATLVYYFLGGLEGSQFNLGPLKLTGSIAALIGSAWFINSQLEQQLIDANAELHINSKHELFDDNDIVFGRLIIDNYELGINQALEVRLSDSVNFGKLSLGALVMNDKFQITAFDSINLGAITKQNLTKLGLFNDANLAVYSEIKYDIRLAAPYDAKVNEAFWEPPNRELRNRYFDLPFKIRPRFIDGADRTEVSYNGEKSYLPLERTHVFSPLLDNDPAMTYFVRVRNLVRDRNKNSYNNYVVYQILGFRNTTIETSG